MNENRCRTDDQGRAFAGSQLQVQIYVSRRQAELSQAVAATVGLPANARLIWVAPLEEQRFAEPMDEEFLRVLGLGRFAPDLARFWPKSGPRWDALARVEVGSELVGVVLAEGKSYPLEMSGPGCQAVDQKSLRQIREAVASAQRWFEVDDPPTDWLGRWYQYANRLSHLYFLREIVGVDAWLANLCFVNDRSATPTHECDWVTWLREVRIELGFALDIPWTADVFLEARDRHELLYQENGR